MNSSDGSQEIQSEEILSQEPTARSLLVDIQRYLTSEAKSALKAPTFTARNNRMAKAVSLESSVLTAKSIGNDELAQPFEQVFSIATLEAGQAFAGAFDELGNPVQEQSEAYQEAIKAAGGIAYKHIPEALTLAGIEVDIDDVLRKSDFGDIVRLAAIELGVNAPQELNPATVIQSLHETAAGDYFESKIDSLPFSDKQPLTEAEQKALDIAVRLANATWKVGQVHRAAWEGNDSRIDPAKREAFNPFDLLKHEQYQRVSKEKSPEDALYRVGLEVYKDKLQYESLVPQVSPAS